LELACTGRGMIRAIMEDERSMESILRELREIVANVDGPEGVADAGKRRASDPRVEAAGAVPRAIWSIWATSLAVHE
jgi:hypothetical protein